MKHGVLSEEEKNDITVSVQEKCFCAYTFVARNKCLFLPEIDFHNFQSFSTVLPSFSIVTPESELITQGCMHAKRNYIDIVDLAHYLVTFRLSINLIQTKSMTF